MNLDDVMRWALENIGEAAGDHVERATRALEEMIELADAVGMEKDVALRLVDRVYAAKPGVVYKEIGQARMTLDLLAHSLGFDAGAASEAEWERIKKIPREEWRRRHGIKKQLGIAK